MTENRHIKRSLARERAYSPIARRVPLRRWVTLFCGLAAIIIQSLVVQSHIHLRQGTGRIATVSIATLAQGAAVSTTQAGTKEVTPRDKYPINEDPTNCPLCKEFAHSGQFVKSAAALVAVPSSVNVHFVVFSEALPSFFVASHSWQGRAPPRV